MKVVNWDDAKSQKLKKERGFSFEDIRLYMTQGALLDNIKHWNTDKYPNQWVYVLNIDNYVYAVPYVENEREIFLKTIFADRKLTKLYLEKNDE